MQYISVNTGLPTLSLYLIKRYEYTGLQTSCHYYQEIRKYWFTSTISLYLI